MTTPPNAFVSRAGFKLEHGLREFAVDPAGMCCADFGCNVGGFTDCLLQHGAAKVYAVDTGYGALAWKLRQDPRVIVLERTNALHLDETMVSGTSFDLITIDLGWTPQRLAIPAALRWLKPGGHIVSLVKPHYELSESERRVTLRKGTLADADAERIFLRTVDVMSTLGLRVLGQTKSPIRGAKSSRRSAGSAPSAILSGSGRGGTGNVEYLILGELISP